MSFSSCFELTTVLKVQARHHDGYTPYYYGFQTMDWQLWIQLFDQLEKVYMDVS